MDSRLIRRLVAEKLRDRTTYVVAAVVGVLINAYGQFLVPWFRGFDDPFAQFIEEFGARPMLTAFSVFIAFAFPLCVGIHSAVAARYKIRRMELIADFPERKPDPVFRAAPDGRLVVVGATTREMFARYGIGRAQEILGEALWQEIRAKGEPGGGAVVVFGTEAIRYTVSHAPTADGHVNVYLARLG